MKNCTQCEYNKECKNQALQIGDKVRITFNEKHQTLQRNKLHCNGTQGVINEILDKKECNHLDTGFCTNWVYGIGNMLYCGCWLKRI